MSTENRSNVNTNNQNEEEKTMMNQEIRNNNINSANEMKEETTMSIIDTIMNSNLLTKTASIVGSFAFTDNGCELLYSKLAELRADLKEYKQKVVITKECLKDFEAFKNAGGDAGNQYTHLRTELEGELAMIAYISADMRTLGRAIKELKAILPADQVCLMRVRDQASAEKISFEKEVPENARTFERSPKIKLGSYKVMAFDITATLADFQPYIKAIFDAVNNENKQEASKRFNELTGFVTDMALSHTPISIHASKAKINSAHQSLAAEIAGVAFDNSTTDKIVSINHNIFNLLNGVPMKYISADREQAVRAVEALEQNILRVICNNGVRLTTLAGRTIDYDVWCSTPSQQKVGAMYLGERQMMAKTSDARNLLMNNQEYLAHAYNGPEMLKRQAVLFTPSCPMKDTDGNFVKLDDICMFDEVDIERTFANVMEIDRNGHSVAKASKALGRTVADGAMYFTNAESQQIRGLGIKAFGVCIGDMMDKIAKKYGKPIPEFVEDCDGVPYYVKTTKVFSNKSTWKWGKLGLSWTEFKARANKLADRYPTINLLRVTRLASSAEEGYRRLSRQTTQQFMLATNEQIYDIVKKPIGKLNRMKTASGMLPKLMELNKPVCERSFLNRLFELMPQLTGSEHLQANWKINFHQRFAEVASNRVPVDGIYPYITEDPVAVLRIFIWHEDPQTVGLSDLKPGEINLPMCEDNKEMFFARYPSNYISAMVLHNHNDHIYDCVGNVAVLPIDADTLIRADGDVDGDEAFISFNNTVIQMIKDTWANFVPYLVDFPHDKAERVDFYNRYFLGTDVDENGKPLPPFDLSKVTLVPEDMRPLRKLLRDEMAEALYNANKFGGDVGKNSILATKWFQNAMEQLAYGNKDKAKECIHTAMYAYIGSILAIDSVKTGKMPEWLVDKLAKISSKKYAGLNPWNQRFNKHNIATPWFDEKFWGPINIGNVEEAVPEEEAENNAVVEGSPEEGEWDFAARQESTSTTDRIARMVLDGTNAHNYSFNAEGMVFDPEMLLSKMDGITSNASKGVFNPKLLPAFNARNYMDEENAAIVTKIQNGEVVGAKELFVFFWRNANSMMYRMQPAGGDKSSNAAMMAEYLRFVRNIMINFGNNNKFMSMTPDQRRMSVVNNFVRDAFEMKVGNGIARHMDNEFEVLRLKGSYAKFVLSVFAQDLVEILEENLDVPEDKRFIAMRMAATGNSEADEALAAEQLDMYSEYDEYGDCELSFCCD